jgi:rhomboid protease GluP
MVVIIALVMMLQPLFPAVLVALERNATLIASGEWWRLVTALFVQDGGLSGGVFNIVGLALIGSVAEYVWGQSRWLVIVMVAGLLSEVVALWWQPIGAGNSVANFGLAGAVAIACIIRRPARAVLLASVVSLASCVALLFQRDIHGAAGLIGAMTALVLARHVPS